VRDITIRPIKAEEIKAVAAFIAAGYYDDKFFKWVVSSDLDRHLIITDYYQVYLNATGCVAHVAINSNNELIGATVWLPHDVDAKIYDDINKVAGIYATNFAEVATKSHNNEPTAGPFYQLVAVVVDKKLQGGGIGAALLRYQIDSLDEANIPTYLEASTPYHGGGIYGKFDYQPFGELILLRGLICIHCIDQRGIKKPPLSGMKATSGTTRGPALYLNQLAGISKNSVW